MKFEKTKTESLFEKITTYTLAVVTILLMVVTILFCVAPTGDIK